MALDLGDLVLEQLQKTFSAIISQLQSLFYDQRNLTPQQKNELELRLQTSAERQVWVKIEILDNNDKVIDEVSGSAVGGSYNIDSSSAIRRTCSITFNLEQGYLPDPNSIFWINKRFKLYIGLKNPYLDNVYWFNKGVYAIKDPTISITLTERTITINGIDKMALHTGDIGGQLDTAFIIDTKDDEDNIVYVENAVEALMKDSGETNLAITQTDFAMPYKIETAIGDMRWDVISKLTDLFYNYQAYYDLDGFFIFDTKPMYQSNSGVVNEIEMNFSQNYDNYMLETIPHNLIISINREIDYNNVKNKIVVYGGVHDDGHQSSYTILVNDENYNSSPYTVEKLNEKNTDGSLVYRTLVIQDDTYIDDGVAESETDNLEKVHEYSMNLCKDRAVQEAYLHQQATDKVTINCLPIYSLDVNKVIYLDDSKSGAIGEYVITNISCGLGVDDTMTLTANKLW